MDAGDAKGPMRIVVLDPCDGVSPGSPEGSLAVDDEFPRVIRPVRPGVDGS